MFCGACAPSAAACAQRMLWSTGLVHGRSFLASKMVGEIAVRRVGFGLKEQTKTNRFYGHNRSDMLAATPLSGRAGARAAVGGEFLAGALSVAPQDPSSTMTHVSPGPPLIPDGRISRVRLAAAAIPEGSSRIS